MSDPTAVNEMLRQAADAYRVFSLELRAARIKQADLAKEILARVDNEKTINVKNLIAQMIYDRNRQ